MPIMPFVQNISQELANQSSPRLQQRRANEEGFFLANLGSSLIELGRNISRMSWGEEDLPEVIATHGLLVQENEVIRRQTTYTFNWPLPQTQPPLGLASSESRNAEGDIMEIKIKALHSRTYNFAVETTISVQALKLLIEQNSGITSERQRLLFRGRALNDDLRSLSDYQVEEGHTVYLVETPQGGASGNNNNPIPPAEMLQEIRQLLTEEVVDFFSILREMDSVNDPSTRRWQEGRLIVESGRVSETLGSFIQVLEKETYHLRLTQEMVNMSISPALNLKMKSINPLLDLPQM
ncbi:unnamed protein product [Microthlaspi erraticum]|uniref:Ubiquitin-like domain-containing protein n=1 Tax=Microthlaspi erraticum TaxID=1685480 RepID=A0A6D2JDM4_9BRAS|nr:unnamed protein product [Microthlaspi erraticum]